VSLTHAALPGRLRLGGPVAITTDRSFGGSKRRLSLKSSADIVVVAP